MLIVPMAVAVRPEACAVPIRVQLCPGEVAGDGRHLRGAQGGDLDRTQRLCLGGGQTAHLAGGQGRDILGGDGRDVRGAQTVQSGGRQPGDARGGQHRDLRGGDEGAQGIDLSGGEHAQRVSAQARQVRGADIADGRGGEAGGLRRADQGQLCPGEVAGDDRHLRGAQGGDLDRTQRLCLGGGQTAHLVVVRAATSLVAMAAMSEVLNH